MKDCKIKDCVCNGTDDWYVNSLEHGNCFWHYFLFNKRTHTLNEIANLLDLSISAVTSVEKKALQKIKKALKQRLEE